MALDQGTGRRKQKRAASLRRVVGENAREKARTPVVQAAREVVDEVVQGRGDPRAQAARQQALGLTRDEKKDVQGYSRVRSNQVQDALFRELQRDTGRFLDEAAGAFIGVKPSTAYQTVTNPLETIEKRGRVGEGSGIVYSGYGPLRVARLLDKLLPAKGQIVPPVPKPAGAEKVVEALPAAKKLRREQDRLGSAERGTRAAKAEQAMHLGGEEGYRAALAELKGELPKLKLGDDLKDFDQKAADELFSHIQQGNLRPFEKIRTQTALRKVLDGQVPTKSEIRLLEQAFGSDLGAQVADSVTWWRKAKNMGLSVINIPRSLQSSFDLSAPFRQGLVLGARNPRMFASEFKPMLKAFAREGAYEDTMATIAEMPHYARMQKGKLALTDLEGSAASREDFFNSQIAETLTGGRKFSPVRMSGRAYTAFLNKFRADAFNHYLRMAEDAGHNIDDERLLKSLATFINTATGRGSIKKLEPSMTALTTVFFSPRLIASRLQFFNPTRYGLGASTHPFVASQNRKAARNLLGGIGLTLALADLAGADVIRDPRSADFGKIKVGNTRIDITGGHQGYVVQAARQWTGETVSSTTGEVTELKGGFGERSRGDVAWDFTKNKLAPWARYGVGWQEDENFEGDPFDPAKEAGKLLVPIGAGSTREAYQQGGPGLAALTGGLGGIGFGVLTYGPQEPKGSSKSSRTSGSRSTSLRSGSGSRRKSLRRP